MEQRNCIVIFSENTGMVTGQIRLGEEVVKELSFYIGKLHKSEPAMVEQMIRSRYGAWAKVNGVAEIQIEYR